MNFKDMLDKLSVLSEATKETEKGRVHKADPGGYGRKYDTDEEGDEKDGDKDAAKPAEKRGRGRPSKTGAHASSPEEKKKQKGREEAGKALQSMIGSAPKKSKELEKLPKKKHSLKEFFEQIDEERMLKEAEQITMEPAKQSAQVIKQGTKTLGTVTNPALAATLKSALGKGEISLAGSELGEEKGEKWIQKAIDPSKKGALRKKLGAKEGEPIPAGKLEKATHSKDPTTARQARLAQTLRKINKEGVNEGWEGVAEGSEPKLGTVRANLMNTQQPTVQVQVYKHNTLRGDSYWVTKEVKTFKTRDQAQAYVDRINKQGVSEGDIPHQSGIDNNSPLSGSGRSNSALEEAKKTVKRDDKAEKAGRKVAKDIEYDEKVKDKIHGKKRHAEDEKAEKAGKKVAKDIEYDEKKDKKKKVNESAHKHSAARLMGKAHALAKEGYNCRYDDMEEARMYHEGYKEGLDECYGLMPIRGVVVGEEVPATVPGMADQAERMAMETDLDEMDKTEYMKHKARTTPGDTFKAFGQTMRDKDVLESPFAFESLDKQLNELLTEGEVVEEGMSVSISKGNQGAPDSVTVSAQDHEAEKLLSFIKQAGLGLFGDEAKSDYGSPAGEVSKHAHGDIEVVDDHDGMMSLMKKMTGMDHGSDDSDYRDEEHHGDHDEETCNECGYMESKCQCDETKEMVEDEDYDQEEEIAAESDELAELKRLIGHNKAQPEVDSKEGMQENNPTTNTATTATPASNAQQPGGVGFTPEKAKLDPRYKTDPNFKREVDMALQIGNKTMREDNPPDSGAKDTEIEVQDTAQANASATDKQMTFGTTMEDGSEASEEPVKPMTDVDEEKDNLKEWANNAGQRGTETTFVTDEEFMIDTITSGLNKRKATGQTTIPVIASQHARDGNEDINAWKKLAGLTK